MKLALATLLGTMTIFSTLAFAASGKRFCPAPWKGATDDCDWQQEIVDNGAVHTIMFVRAGYLPENPEVPFRGNIIYYEGLGDSMVNHAPLFSELTNAGYRVIAFDYMGQGGSGGSMNDTRIQEIISLGNRMWDLYARDHQVSKTIIGWSTGGLAAYLQAAKDPNVDRVVLLAPGVVIKLAIGEQHPDKFEFNQITLATLTSQRYGREIFNPHIDPIRPTTPNWIPFFAVNLLKESIVAQHSAIPARVHGLVLLSGPGDAYVDGRKTLPVIQKQAPQFVVKAFEKSFHEIDNEAYPTGIQAREDIVEFLKNN